MINIGKPLEPSGLLNLAWMAVNSKSAKKQFAFPLKFYTEHQFGFSFTYFEISAETMKAYYRVSMHSRLTEPPAVNSMPKTCLMTLSENIHRWGQDPCTYSRSPVLQAWTELAHYILIKTYFLFCKILSCLTGDQPYIDPSTYYSEYSLTQTGLQIQMYENLLDSKFVRMQMFTKLFMKMYTSYASLLFTNISLLHTNVLQLVW